MACLLTGMLSAAKAQTYDVIERRNPWNAGDNVTGIRADSVTSSYAELRGGSEHGDFRDDYEASRRWSAGATAKTITHLERYSLTGTFSFTHASGREMSGSMFIHPGLYPVDVLEFTPGRKDLQTYSFMGGVSYDLGPRWRVGARIDFTSANYTKRKDLRHTNYRLDLQAAPAVSYRHGDWTIGAVYLFGKNSESVSAEVVGTAETIYNAFLDKGLMYGAYEAWDGSGVHLSESGVDGFPVREFSHGAALQLQWRSLYADVAYTRASGTVGEKEHVWFRFPTHCVASRLIYTLRRGERAHFLRLTLSWARQVNHENVLGQETNDGVTITRVYGSNRIFERSALRVNPEYELMDGRRGELTAGAEALILNRMMTQMYPYAVSQRMTVGRVYLAGTLHLGRLNLKAAAGFSAGSCSEQEHTATIDTEPGDPPYRMSDRYERQNEYATAPRLTVGAGCRYNFGNGIYAEARAGYVRAFDLSRVEGPDRWRETVKIGYTF